MQLLGHVPGLQTTNKLGFFEYESARMVRNKIILQAYLLF